jgi:flagellar biosynthesis chaperone FliJ
MRGALTRLLCIRAIEEERARMELEAEAARLESLDQAVGRAAEEARDSRQRWFALVEPGADGKAGGDDAGTAGAGGPPGGRTGEASGETGTARRLEEALWAAASGERADSEARRPAQQAEVERARAEFLEGRRRRMQIESVVHARAAEAVAESGRREQRQLDDWFQSRLRQTAAQEEDAETEVPAHRGRAGRF